MSNALSRQEARQAIQTALEPFGYGPECVRFDWPLPNSEAVRRYLNSGGEWRHQRPEGGVVTLDLLAFSNPLKQDWQTTAIAAALDRDSVAGGLGSKPVAKQLFEATAAPTNIIGSATDGRVDVWFSCHDGMRLEAEVALNADALSRVFSENRADIQRDRVAGLRSGQRHLFDRYLYAQREELATFLQHGVSKAVWKVAEESWGQEPSQRQQLRSAFSQVALALLAARILEDKGALTGVGPTSQAHQLLHKAENDWDMFFTPVLQTTLPKLERSLGCDAVGGMLAEVLAHLRGPVNFGLVTHEMLGDFWEATAVAERHAGRKGFVDLKGVHYTPFGIAKQILDRIPLEDIPPTARTVCDFACGSGSFLLAATERLSDLFDPREPGVSDDRVKYLREHVLGNDLDRPAVLVAKLSYVLAYWSQASPNPEDLPTPDVLVEEDALQLDVAARSDKVPTVIVGNPPFGGRNPPGQFLERALHILESCPSPSPRYLGMVMPAAFLVCGKTHGHALEALRREARILEVWELPERAVGLYAEHPTCVVIAEITGAKGRRASPVRVCQTRSRKADARRAFRDRGVPGWSYAVHIAASEAGQVIDTDAHWAFSPLQPIWDGLAGQGRELSRICATAWGFVHTRMHGKPDPVFSTRRGRGFVPFFHRQSALMPYQVTKDDWKASHKAGEGFYWQKGTGPVPCKANWPKYESPKIMVSARSNRNARRQLVAAVDLHGLYPAKDLLAIGLRDEWRGAARAGWDDPSFLRAPESSVLCWLCAILNSPIGHAWVAAYAGPRGPREDVFENLPLPSRYNPEIASMVKRLERMARPENLRAKATWDPEGGIVSVPSGLFEEEATGVAEAGNDYWQHVQKINELVLASYGLTKQPQKQIRVYLQSMTDPWADHQADVADLPADTKLRVLRGRTGRVDVVRQSIKLELSWRSMGNGKPVELAIPKFMPGWALEEGREFSARAPEGCTLKDIQANPWLLRDFRPVPYGYLDRKALETMIGYEAGGESGEPS